MRKTEQTLGWLVAALYIFYVGYGMVYHFIEKNPSSAKQAAGFLLEDREFGFLTLPAATKFGDSIILELKSQSGNFSNQVNNRNAIWIAQLLGSVRSDLSRQTAEELCRRDQPLQKLMGSAALSLQERNPDTSYPIKILEEADQHLDHEIELAIVGLSDSSNPAAVKHLRHIAEHYPESPEIELKAINSLLKRKDSEGLRIAIRRLDRYPNEPGKDELWQNLVKATGQDFGFDSRRWSQWLEASSLTKQN